MAVVSAVAAGISAVAGVAGAVTKGIAQKRQAKQQEEEARVQREILGIQQKQAEREGRRTLGQYQAGAGARGVRGASSEAVEGAIQTETATQLKIYEKHKEIQGGRIDTLSRSQGLLTAATALGAGSAILGGVGDIYGIGYDAGWWPKE